MAELTAAETNDCIRRITMEDHEFFALCMRGNIKGAELIVRIILARDDIRVRSIETEYEMQNIAHHSVRLDAYCTDEEGRLYDIEIQVDEKGALPQRARYYSAMMDTSVLGKGEGYDTLPESYVIFITWGDIIGDGKAVSMIERRAEGTWTRFRDGTHIVYVVAPLAEEDTELGRLMHDFMCPDPGKMYYTDLRGKAAEAKEDKEEREAMGPIMREIYNKGIETGRKEGIETGHKEGVETGRRETAHTMLADGQLPLSKIAEYSGLSLGEVQSIRNSMNL